MSFSDSNAFGSTMAAKLTNQLRDDIISHRIKPGSRLTVKEVSDRYGVSSMPVREAFFMLSGENFLELNPYKGATVIAATPEMVAQINDLQYALESLLLELCFKKGYSSELLDELERINQEMDIEVRQKKDLSDSKRVQLNMQFHRTEYSLCEDHMAYRLFERNLNQLGAIRRHYELDQIRAAQTVQEHQQIIQALRNNDLISAAIVTKQHTLNSKRYALTEKYDD